MHCTINDDAVLLCFLCVDVLKLVWANSGLTILWQQIIKNVYKYKNITEAKYKNNKIQKYTYEMFCGLSELTQVWPSSDKKLSKWYRYKNITEAEYKNNTIQKYNYEMFCGWSELTQVWPPGDSSDQAASQPRRQKYQIICLYSKLKLLNLLRFQISSNFSDFFLIFFSDTRMIISTGQLPTLF